jgi:hypothetical protein
VVEIQQHLALRLVGRLRRLLDVEFNDVGVAVADAGQLEALALGRLQPLPNSFQEILVVREHDHLRAGRTAALDALLRRDPQRAKAEILKHLDGDLVIVPRPSLTGERRAEISGRAKSDSLLGDQEAVCLQVVAGARNHRNRLASPSR